MLVLVAMLAAAALVPAAVAAAAPDPAGLFEQLGADIDGEAANDQSGLSVSVSSDGATVAIGAPLNSGANGAGRGHVRVYRYDDGTSGWGQVGSDIDGEADADQFGYSVSLSSDGSTVAIGGRFNDGNGPDSGHVRVFTLSGGAWVQVGADIEGEAADDWSGESVSLSDDGSTVAIGARLNDGNGLNSGHVRVFALTGGAWVQVGVDIEGEAADDQSGYSVSLSSDGSSVAIGAVTNDGNGLNSGHVRVFTLSGGAWVQVGVDIRGEAADDLSGWSVSLSSDGSSVAIGAVFNDGNGGSSGHVRVFALTGGAWVQVGVDIDGEAGGDRSGWSVSLSGDGSTVAIGAPFNRGNGSQSGHVRVFTLSGGAWVQVGADIDSEAGGDRSGFSVALAADGSTVAIGADFNGGNGFRSGHVRVWLAGVAPGITVPAGVTAEATDSDGAVVEYTVTATDNVDGDVAVNCGPASGTVFALGTTTVACSASDAAGNTATASFDVAVVRPAPANRAPVAADDSALTIEGRAVTVPVLANDRDPDGHALRVGAIVSPPVSGTATIEADGRVRYEPGAGVTGTDSFTYRVEDGRGGSDTAEVTVTVEPAGYLATACPAGEVPALLFDDVPAESIHASAVACMAWFGVAQGTTATTFSPAEPTTRAQVATLLTGVLTVAGVDLPDAPPDAFGDDDGTTHELAINQLAALGVVRGTTATTYGPRSEASRGEIVALLAATFELVAGALPEPSGDHFGDDDGGIFERSIDQAADAGFTTGVTEATYRPGDPGTRAQMASFLARVLDRLLQQGFGSTPG